VDAAGQFVGEMVARLPVGADPRRRDHLLGLWRQDVAMDVDREPFAARVHRAGKPPRDLRPFGQAGEQHRRLLHGFVDCMRDRRRVYRLAPRRALSINTARVPTRSSAPPSNGSSPLHAVVAAVAATTARTARLSPTSPTNMPASSPATSRKRFIAP